MMGAVESIDLSCCTPVAILFHIRGDFGASHLTFVPPAPCSFFFALFFRFYFLEEQGETGERGMKCDDKMLISDTSKKLLKRRSHIAIKGGVNVCVD